MNKLLRKAIMLAYESHEGQLDKSGLPYIIHPITVMNGVDSDKEKIVAVLHDVVEDTNVKIRTIYDEFGEEIAEAVELLTKSKGQDYFQYIEALKGNYLAMNVKVQDLKHNMDLTRLPRITERDKDRQDKYEEAYLMLTNFRLGKRYKPYKY